MEFEYVVFLVPQKDVQIDAHFFTSYEAMNRFVQSGVLVEKVVKLVCKGNFDIDL